MEDEKRSWFDRLFPRMTDFGALLTEQAVQVESALGELAAMLANHGVDIERIEALEADADRLRRHNTRALNEAFATPFDREDIQRATEELEWIVVHTMSTAREMAVLEVPTDEVITEMLAMVIEGVSALREGFAHLADDPDRAAQAIERARRVDRRARRRYEQGLAQLFDGDDPLRVLRHREIYHHLKDAAKRVFESAVVLEAIHVKNV